MDSLLDELETAVREHERITQAIAQLEERLDRKSQAHTMLNRQSEFELAEMRQMLEVLRSDSVTAAASVADIKAKINE